MSIAGNKRAVVTTICFMRGVPTPRPDNKLAIHMIYAMNSWRFMGHHVRKGVKSWLY